MKRFWIILALCGISLAVYADTQSPLAIGPFNEGVKRFNAQQYEDAIPYFDRALAHDAYFAEAYYARGACQHALHHASEALMDLNRAVGLNAKLIDAVTLRGVISYETQQWDAALTDFNYVLSQNPVEPQSLLGRGAIYIQREELDKAEKDFRAFLRVRPDDPMAPRVRKVLTSLSRAPLESAEESAPVPAADGSPTTAAPPHRKVRTVTPEMKQITSDLLFQSHRTSEDAAQKAMRGQQGAVTGDAPSSDR